MSYFPDLSVYSYIRSEQEAEIALNIGWLSKEHAYAQGDVPEEVIKKLWNYCKVFINPTRGISFCEFCDKPITVTFMGEELLLGSSEIRVVGKDTKIYASPNLIFHYIVDHHYLPPKEFIQAVRQGPLPGSEQYEAAIKSLRQWRMP